MGISSKIDIEVSANYKDDEKKGLHKSLVTYFSNLKGR